VLGNLSTLNTTSARESASQVIDTIFHLIEDEGPGGDAARAKLLPPIEESEEILESLAEGASLERIESMAQDTEKLTKTKKRGRQESKPIKVQEALSTIDDPRYGMV